MQTNKSKISNTRKIKGIIKKKYNEEEQELNLSELMFDLGDHPEDWRSVLMFRDWSALRALSLGHMIIT